MVDRTNVCLVDAHPEGDGGNHDIGLTRHEGLLHLMAGLVFQPGVVGLRLQSLFL